MVKKFPQKGLILFLTLPLLLPCCAPPKKIEVAPPSSEFEEQIVAANALYRKGCYVPLKNAFRGYQRIYSQPNFRKKIAAKLVKTSLLIAVREKELGMANRVYMDAALQTIKENPSLNDLTPYAEIAGLFWVQGKGVMRDIDERFSWRETEVKIGGRHT